jgi:hypothetical protein
MHEMLKVFRYKENISGGSIEPHERMDYKKNEDMGKFVLGIPN